jgi:aminopeptidase N
VAAQDDPRLPRHVVPERYELTLAPDLERATFNGEERVAVRLLESTDEIVMNALDLEITAASLVAPDGERRALEVSLDEDSGRLFARLAEPAGPGEAALEMSFSGTLNDKLRGFYRSTFKDGDKERVIATTQFEPTDARRAFPCWDEPDRKAVFSISLDVKEGLAAVSNARVVEEVDLGSRRRRIRFADTIAMSTYLVAFVVGTLERTDPVVVDGVDVSVVHVPRKGSLTAFALEVAEHALRFFSSWFEVPYPGDKLDLIALPDFAAGAMENLGAVTFRESVLLVDEARASRTELERIADVISHEIAHMWFGDLVTMSWWNGLWLNEAFATFMEMLCVDAFRSEWERWVTFGRSKGAAMSTDGLPSTRPIEYPVGRPEEAEGMFDILTYEKGAGILRMLERYLGHGEFRRGIRRYLRGHLYANADTTDLWDAIEEATGEPVRQTMDSWIFQGGHPLVTVSPGPRASELRLDQRPFRYHRLPVASGAAAHAGGVTAETAARDSIGSDWKVPVLLRASVEGSIEERRVLLGADGAAVELSGEPEWVVANSGGSGFYRVSYGDGLLGWLTGKLSALDGLERYNLVSDTWAGVLAGLVALTDFVALARLLGDERDPNVWSIVSAAVGLMDRVIGPQDRQALEAFTRELFGSVFSEVGWTAEPGEPERTGTLRATLVDTLGTVGADEDVRLEARRLHERFLFGDDPIPPDLAGAVVTVVATSGGEKEYEGYLGRFRSPSNPQEELRYLYGLAGFRDPSLIEATLDLSLKEVRTQNAGFLILQVLANRVGGAMAWEFVKQRWDELVARLPDNTIPRMLEGVTALCQPDLAADVHAFLEAHPLRSGQRTVEQIRERLDVNVAFALEEGPGLGPLLAGPG